MWRRLIDLTGQKKVSLSSIEIKTHHVATVSAACFERVAKYVPIKHVIPSYRNNYDMLEDGEKATAFFMALGVSEVCLLYQKTTSIDAIEEYKEPVWYILP